MSDSTNDLEQDLLAQDLSPQELLTQINAAIVACSQAQSYKVGSRSVTRANVTELKKLRADLMQEIAANNADNSLMAGVSVAVFDGR